MKSDAWLPKFFSSNCGLARGHERPTIVREKSSLAHDSSAAIPADAPLSS
jgi:hypothetical protein